MSYQDNKLPTLPKTPKDLAREEIKALRLEEGRDLDSKELTPKEQAIWAQGCAAHKVYFDQIREYLLHDVGGPSKGYTYPRQDPPCLTEIIAEVEQIKAQEGVPV